MESGGGSATSMSLSLALLLFDVPTAVEADDVKKDILSSRSFDVKVCRQEVERDRRDCCSEFRCRPQ